MAGCGNLDLLDIVAQVGAQEGKTASVHQVLAGFAGAQCAPLSFYFVVNRDIEQNVGYMDSDHATCYETMITTCRLTRLFSAYLSIEEDRTVSDISLVESSHEQEMRWFHRP